MARRNTPDYLPSIHEIARQCAAIRAAWTPSERRRRTVDQELLAVEDNGWLPPMIDTTMCLARVRRTAVEASA